MRNTYDCRRAVSRSFSIFAKSAIETNPVKTRVSMSALRSPFAILSRIRLISFMSVEQIRRNGFGDLFPSQDVTVMGMIEVTASSPRPISCMMDSILD